MGQIILKVMGFWDSIAILECTKIQHAYLSKEMECTP
jgi:hypothetical protein